MMKMGFRSTAIGSVTIALVILIASVSASAESPAVHLDQGLQPTATPSLEPSIQGFSAQSSPGQEDVPFERGIDTSSFVVSFYDQDDLIGFVGQRADTPPVNFTLECFGESFPYSGCNLDDQFLSEGGNYSAQWEGTLIVPVDGDYTFGFGDIDQGTFLADDGARLLIDGTEIVDNGWRFPAADINPSPQSVFLTAGQHDLVLDYEQRVPAAASLELHWAGPGLNSELVSSYVPYECTLPDPPLSPAGEAVDGVVQGQNFCNNSFLGLLDAPGDPAGQDTGIHAWADLIRQAEHEVLLTTMYWADDPGTSD